MARLRRSGCAVSVVGLTVEEEFRQGAAAWAQRTATEQGYPALIEDEDALATIATLLWDGGDAPDAGQTRQSGRTRVGSKRLRPGTAAPIST